MAGIPHDSIKLVFGGKIEGVQDWSCGLWCSIALTGGAWSITDQNTVTQALAGNVATAWGNLKQLASAGTTYDYTKTYFYPSGATVASQLGSYTNGSPVAGTGSHYHGSGQSMVASLRTDVPGRSGRGRIYLPSNAVTITSHLDYGTSDIAVGAANVAALIGNLNDYSDTALNVTSLTTIVASFTKHQFNDITSVICDSKPDYQRRREDNMPISNTNVQPIP